MSCLLGREQRCATRWNDLVGNRYSRMFLDHPSAWVRNDAKKLLKAVRLG